jgi:beta-galactosidase GanA
VAIRVRRPEAALTDAWRSVPVPGRGGAMLGFSFRPLQAEALGLDPGDTLATLLERPVELVRLGAYWNRMEPAPGAFRPQELDRWLDAVERAGARVIVCVGAVKTFGYPEFFAPAHHLPTPLPEGRRVTPGTHPALLEAAAGFVARVVERYRDRPSVVAWQVEHEAVDPLGAEHSWRLDEAFVRHEVDAVRQADPTRPIVMNGFLPTSTPVRTVQWWRTRDQGDSVEVAQRMADVVGMDVYPRHALVGVGGRTVYLDAAGRPRQGGRREKLLAWAAADPGRRLMVAEGQAEPWEAVTTPPSPSGAAPYSCPPEMVVGTYRDCMAWAGAAPLWAYLFWGAEYWVRRARDGDGRYLAAFERVLAGA